MTKRRRNEIRAAEGGQRLELDIYGEIGGDWFFGGVTSESLAAVLREYSTASEIVLNVNSRGGSFREAIAIRALLKRHAARVVARIDALAASAASLLVMAADEITIPPGAYMMIHEARQHTDGTAQEHEANAAILRSINADMRDIYAARTGQPPDKVESDMAATLYLSAAQAVEYGLADRIDGEAVALAAEDFRGLEVPSVIRAAMHTTTRKHMDITAMAAQLGCAPTEDAVKAQLSQLRVRADIAADAQAKAKHAEEALAVAQAEVLALQVAAKSREAEALASALRAEGRIAVGSKTEERINAAVASGDVAALTAYADVLREQSPAVPVGGRQTTTAGAPTDTNLAPPPMANGKIDYAAVMATLPAETQALYASKSPELILTQPASASLWARAGYRVPQ